MGGRGIRREKRGDRKRRVDRKCSEEKGCMKREKRTYAWNLEPLHERIDCAINQDVSNARNKKKNRGKCKKQCCVRVKRKE